MIDSVASRPQIITAPRQSEGTSREKPESVPTREAAPKESKPAEASAESRAAEQPESTEKVRDNEQQESRNVIATA